jgi:hypothetical protein
MNSLWTSAANEVANIWHAAQANPAVAIAALALTVAVGHQLSRLIPPKRTPTAFDNPELKALRAKRVINWQKLGLGQPREP